MSMELFNLSIALKVMDESGFPQMLQVYGLSLPDAQMFIKRIAATPSGERIGLLVDKGGICFPIDELLSAMILPQTSDA